MSNIEIINKTDDFEIQYRIEGLTSIEAKEILHRHIEEIDVMHNHNKSLQEQSNAKIEALNAEMTLLDCSMSVVSGVISGIIDSFFVGEFSLDRGTAWGKEKVEDFVQWVAKKQGYTGESLAGSVSFLEKNNPIAADLVTNKFGGGKTHHLHDFSHHPTPVGLFFSILTQFTGRVYGTKASSLITADSPGPRGSFVSYPVPNNELIGKDLPSKIALGFTKWLFHMVSDMAASSSSIYQGKYGTGLPGPVVSLLKELSSLSIFQNQEGVNKFSLWVSRLYNGTLLANHDENGKIVPETLIKFDLRTEIGVGYEITRQTLPIVINECIVRGYYLLNRLIYQIKNKNISSWTDYRLYKAIDWQKVLPTTKNNRTLARMLTIACGTFTIIDITDASVRAAIKSGKNPIIFAKEFILHVNFAGLFRFAIAVHTDAEMGVERWKEHQHLQNLISSEIAVTNAKLYYKQGEQKIAEIEATNAVSQLHDIVSNSIPDTLDAMERIYESHQTLRKTFEELSHTSPEQADEIKKKMKMTENTIKKDVEVGSKIKELTSCVRAKDEYLQAVEKAERKAKTALKTAKEAAQEKTGLLNTDAVRHLQLACIDVSNALISQTDSQKKAFENQKKLAETIRYLFTISIHNLTSYRKVINDLTSEMETLSGSPEDERIKNEIYAIIEQFKGHEDILLRLEKTENRLKAIENKLNI